MTTAALITGASGGLGECFARILAWQKENLVLVARSEEKLNALAQELSLQHGVRVLPIAMDLSHADAVDQLIAELAKSQIDISILINNAGFGGYGKFTERTWQEDGEMIDLNMRTLTELTKKILPDMIAKRRGQILNVASTASFQPGPLMAVYYATKAYVLSFSVAIRNELKGTGVTVTTLCPGPTKTGFATHADLGGSPLFLLGVMDAMTVAQRGIDGMRRGKNIVIPGWKNRVTTFCTRLVPVAFAARVARLAQEKSAGFSR